MHSGTWTAVNSPFSIVISRLQTETQNIYRRVLTNWATNTTAWTALKSVACHYLKCTETMYCRRNSAMRARQWSVNLSCIPPPPNQLGVTTRTYNAIQRYCHVSVMVTVQGMWHGVMSTHSYVHTNHKTAVMLQQQQQRTSLLMSTSSYSWTHLHFCLCLLAFLHQFMRILCYAQFQKCVTGYIKSDLW